MNLGLATETSPGSFMFTDAPATNLLPRIYQVRTP